jgi:hypothetical protein
MFRLGLTTQDATRKSASTLHPPERNWEDYNAVARQQKQRRFITKSARHLHRVITTLHTGQRKTRGYQA